MSAQYRMGDWVPFHFDAGIIVGSYFVSLVGSITTVELLHRKREGSKWYTSKWLQQLAISVSFGLVAIWCMHYVGNRAIIMGDGDKSIQLYYSAGFTTLSAILPIIFLFCGLSTVEIRQPGQRFFWPALVVAGTVAGLAITGMHYIGNFGISNYKLHFPAGYVVGAAAIAIVASIATLAMFYYFKGRWINSWPRRLVCACSLAGAVSGMHWVASVGTRYELSQMRNKSAYSARNANLIVALVISLVCCLACLAFALFTQRRKKQLADRAQHVVLASATFDKEGRIMVTQEGLLPCQMITKEYNQRSFDDEFTIAHPVFQWLYRVTFNWPSVVDIIPAMRHHLRVSGGHIEPVRPSTQGTAATWENEEASEDYSVVFREHFCVAVSDLAADMQVPIQEMGVLFNGILQTGSLAAELQPKKPFRLTRFHEKDVEQGIVNPTIFGRGQLLFLVRQADKQEAQRLIGEGYRFAQVNQVGDIISRSMHVPHQELATTVSRLQKYSVQEREPLTAHTYLGCFALRAALKADGGWDILVPSEAHTQLPMVELTNEPLTQAQVKILNRLDGLSVNQCLAYLNNTVSDMPNVDDKEWTELLLDQISALVVDVPEQFFGHAVFSSKPIKVSGVGFHDTASAPSSSHGPMQLYSFSVIPDVHSASIKSTNKVTYIPLTFFRCSQRVYKNSPDHAILARKIHREFGTVLANSQLQHPFITPTQIPTSSRRNSLDKASQSTYTADGTDVPNSPVKQSYLSPDPQDRSSGIFTPVSPTQPTFDKRVRIPAFLLPTSIARSVRFARGDRVPSGGEKSSVRSDGHISSLSNYPGTVGSGHSTHSGNATALMNPFGGIMVSSDTTVEVQQRDELPPTAVVPPPAGTPAGVPASVIPGGGHRNARSKDLGMGVMAVAGQGAKEEPTYVDELYRMASSRWTRQDTNRGRP